MALDRATATITLGHYVAVTGQPLVAVSGQVLLAAHRQRRSPVLR